MMVKMMMEMMMWAVMVMLWATMIQLLLISLSLSWIGLAWVEWEWRRLDCVQSSFDLVASSSSLCSVATAAEASSSTG